MNSCQFQALRHNESCAKLFLEKYVHTGGKVTISVTEIYESYVAQQVASGMLSEQLLCSGLLLFCVVTSMRHSIMLLISKSRINLTGLTIAHGTQNYCCTLKSKAHVLCSKYVSIPL